MKTLKYFGADIELDSYESNILPHVGCIEDGPSNQRSRTYLQYSQQYFVFVTRHGRTIRVIRNSERPLRDEYPVEIRGIHELWKSKRETGPVEIGGGAPDLAEAVFSDGYTEWVGIMDVPTPPAPPAPDDMLDYQAAAEYSQRTVQTVRNWDKDELLPGAIGKGRTRRIPRRSLDPLRKRKEETKKPRKKKR